MRRRILLLVIGMTALVVLAFAIPIAILTRYAVGQNAETDTKNRAGNIALLLRNGATDARLAALAKQQTSDSGRPVSITSPGGTTYGSTPADRGPTPVPGRANGYANRPVGGGVGGGYPNNDDAAREVQLRGVPGGEVAIAFASSTDGLYLVRVYLSDATRYAGATAWFLLLASGSILLLLVGIGAGEVLTRRITRPLVRTAQTAQQLSVGDTTARAPTEGPREVADVGKALNRLADRIDELIAEERETVADLSHRLRTPLTTLRLDAEALRNPAEAERVGGHIGELERMLTAVIRAARRPQREGRMPSCDATEVVGDRVEFWSALTDEQGRHTELMLPAAPLPVRAAAEDLAAAVDALLENIVAHTPEGAAFSVLLAATDTGARLEISDAGAGIPADADIRGRSDRGSSGLGLDIARRCADASGGSMTIGHTPTGGALVTLLLHSP